MKHIFKFIFILAAALAVSCKSDNTENQGNGSGDKDELKAKEWMYGKLSDWYLWRDDVLAKKPDYNKDYKNFYYSLLSTNREDGRAYKDGHRFFSLITRYAASRADETAAIYEQTQGMDFVLVAASSDESPSTPVYALVTYVKPGSPAETAGIVRGDYIYNVDDTNMTRGNYGKLYPKILSDRYSDGNPSKATVKWYHYPGPTEMGPATLSPVRMEDDPIYVCKRIGDTGYLFYNSFETGGDDHPYDDRLKRVIREELNGVSNIVVDVRYNGGGYVTCCQLLSSMIADRAGDTFMTFEYNSKQGSRSTKFLNVSEMKAKTFGNTEAGVNLGLETVYVITSESSASASEALIHCLRGVDVKVVTIGENTYGKNVGMSQFSDTFGSYKYEIHPVTFYIRNAKDQKYTAAGFKPDYPISEVQLDYMNSLGDPEEALLGAALYHIKNGTFSGYTPAGSRTSRSAAQMPEMIHAPSPVTNGMIYKE